MKTNNLIHTHKHKEKYYSLKLFSRLLTVIATIPKSRTESYINPLELICTGSRLINALKNHGKARPTRRSKTLEPNVFETPISTKPK